MAVGDGVEVSSNAGEGVSVGDWVIVGRGVSVTWVGGIGVAVFSG